MIIELGADDQARREETAAIRDQMARQISTFVGNQMERETHLPGLNFFKVTTPQPPTPYLYEPSLAIIIRGRKRVVLGNTTYIYDASRFLLTAVNLPTITEVTDASPERPYLSLLMKIDLQMARQLIADVETLGPKAEIQHKAMATGPATVDLMDATSRLVRLLDQPHDMLHLGSLVQREILYRVLTSSAGGRFRDTVMVGTQSQRVAKAVTWLRDHYTQPLKIEALAELAEMGVSTLHHHFRKVTSMSPLQYQKHLRLYEARRLLIAENIDAATAGIRVGYESISQFNREYRRMFGAPPIRDVAPLRSI
ncbi:AraC family transcriptional regulator [uncultured Salinicola sp.]|uniref:AraC family transcriptional regulator n=1 Tax=uncultured Salinicola sp. TaxID=1193542 RepID=UPI002630A6D1|nr:AraC family transcriptional regulator [uncultured Salinicola sp.]